MLIKLGKSLFIKSVCLHIFLIRKEGIIVKQEEKRKFEKLLEKRRSMSKSANSKKVSANDSQLRDIIKNFKEQSEYKKLI